VDAAGWELEGAIKIGNFGTLKRTLQEDYHMFVDFLCRSLITLFVWFAC
jgi:hypothetical protein